MYNVHVCTCVSTLRVCVVETTQSQTRIDQYYQLICKEISQYNMSLSKRGFRGFKPPPKFSDFFLKSEGKEIERKRKKRMLGEGGGGYPLTYFWG